MENLASLEKNRDQYFVLFIYIIDYIEINQTVILKSFMFLTDS